MGGGAVRANSDAMLARKDLVDVQGEIEFAVSRQFERQRAFDGHEQAISRDVVRIAALLVFVLTPATFDRQKDVATLPIPVQAVHVWVERMLRRIVRRIGK